MSLTTEMALLFGAIGVVGVLVARWLAYRFDREFPPTKPANQQAKHG